MKFDIFPAVIPITAFTRLKNFGNVEANEADRVFCLMVKRRHGFEEGLKGRGVRNETSARQPNHGVMVATDINLNTFDDETGRFVLVV